MKPATLRDRLGCLTIGQHMIDELIDSGGVERQACFNAIFHDFVIVEAKTHFHNLSVEYVGYHPLFAVVDRQCMPPHYEATVTRTVGDHGIISFDVQFTKVNP